MLRTFSLVVTSGKELRCSLNAQQLRWVRARRNNFRKKPGLGNALIVSFDNFHTFATTPASMALAAPDVGKRSVKSRKKKYGGKKVFCSCTALRANHLTWGKEPVQLGFRATGEAKLSARWHVSGKSLTQTTFSALKRRATNVDTVSEALSVPR
jgi:hypothetical protein